MSDNKKPLSDWLVASDIDGTLNNKFRKLPKRNYEAIHKYVDELGGNFILSSGRSVESMRKHFKNLNISSGYAVFVNGAGVYDYNKEKIIWFSPVEEAYKQVVMAAFNKFKNGLASLQIVTLNDVMMVNGTLPAKILAKSSKLPIVKYKSTEEFPEVDWCKVIFTAMPPTLKKIEAYIRENIGTDGKNLMYSSLFSFEVVSGKTNKGVAVMKAAELLGVDPSKTAAIGDFFNDYEMLKAVALPACCGQAPNEMKKISKLVTCHCNNGAVADLIEYIIKNNNKL